MNYLDKCRICVRPVNTIKIEITNDIKIEYSYLTNTELEESENYSKIICPDCFICLQSCYKFKNFCIVNQNKLKESVYGKAVKRRKPEARVIPLSINTSIPDPLQPETLENVLEIIKIEQPEVPSNPKLKDQKIPEDQGKEKTNTKNVGEEEIFEKPEKPSVQLNIFTMSEIFKLFNFRRYFCDLCDRSYTLRGTLNVHKKKFHYMTYIKKTFLCDHCPYQAGTRVGLTLPLSAL